MLLARISTTYFPSLLAHPCSQMIKDKPRLATPFALCTPSSLLEGCRHLVMANGRCEIEVSGKVTGT